jgi:hypothetical protein
MASGSHMRTLRSLTSMRASTECVRFASGGLTAWMQMRSANPPLHAGGSRRTAGTPFTSGHEQPVRAGHGTLTDAGERWRVVLESV